MVTTAHSTAGWRWYHAAGFYFGGVIYSTADDGQCLIYNAGRDSTNGSRCPYHVAQCEKANCDAYYPPQHQTWVRICKSERLLYDGRLSTATPQLCHSLTHSTVTCSSSTSLQVVILLEPSFVLHCSRPSAPVNHSSHSFPILQVPNFSHFRPIRIGKKELSSNSKNEIGISNKHHRAIDI